MFCHKCGTQINDGVVFCPNCGTKVASVDADQQPMDIPVPNAKRQQASGAKEDTNTQQTSSNNTVKGNETKRKVASVGSVLMWGSLVLLMPFWPLRISPFILIPIAAIGMILKVFGPKPLSLSTKIEAVAGVFLLVVVIAASVMSSSGENDKYVQIVKSGTLDAYPQMTVGKAFDDFLDDPKWESGLSDDNERFVNVKGGILYYDEEAELIVQFLVDEKDNSFQYHACEIDGIPQNNLVVLGLFETIYDSVSAPAEAPTSSNTMVDDSDHPIYAEALWNLIMYNTLPDGNIANDLDGKIDGMWDKFAICDINQDGAAELLIKIESGSESGCGQYIYQVNSDHTGLELLYSFFTDAVYYDTGFIKEDWSHNQGLSENFWPYSILQWEMDGCREVAGVDAWEKMAWETDFSGNSFPDGVDLDGNGIVYFIGGENGIDYDNPVDDAEYNVFVKKYFSTGKEIYVPWRDITEENVEAATGYMTEDYGALSEEGDTDYWGEEDGGFYWVGKDDLKISDPSLVGRWRSYDGGTLEFDNDMSLPACDFQCWSLFGDEPNRVYWSADNGQVTCYAYFDFTTEYSITLPSESRTGEERLKTKSNEYVRIDGAVGDGLIGTWENVFGEMWTFRFNKDGTGMYNTKFPIKWSTSMTDDGRSAFNYTLLDITYFDYQVTGDRLTVFLSNGSRTYTRVGN